MAKQVRVLLLENVSSIGSAGDIVSVAEGYARNALFPQGKAALATSSIQDEYEKNKLRQAKAAQLELEELQAQADALDETELVITAKVKDGDDIYGSITGKEIAGELSKQTKLNIKAKNIVLDEPIKKIGSHMATLQLSPDVEAEIAVTVTPEEEVKES